MLHICHRILYCSGLVVRGTMSFTVLRTWHVEIPVPFLPVISANSAEQGLLHREDLWAGRRGPVAALAGCY